MKSPSALALHFALCICTGMSAAEAVPAFGSEQIGIPPLSLLESTSTKPMTFSPKLPPDLFSTSEIQLGSISPSLPKAPARPRVSRSTGMPIIEPNDAVDYSMTIIPPDPNLDLKMRVKNPDSPDAK